MDVTAYRPFQHDWSMDPNSYSADQSAILIPGGPPVPRVDPAYAIGAMRYDDRIVLDWEGDPVREFENLPYTISSRVEGCRLELWFRQHSAIRYKDILARMRTKVQRPSGTVVPIYNDHVLSSRMSVFRRYAPLDRWS